MRASRGSGRRGCANSAQGVRCAGVGVLSLVQVPDGLDPVGEWDFGYPLSKPTVDTVAASRAALGVLGNEPELGPPNKYATVTPYGLDNARDVVGDIIATKDW